ncbi:MAG: NmrA family NAD(P)-binding protein [Bacteroidota bacterium]
MPERILITGATGTSGYYTIRPLVDFGGNDEIIAGVRKIDQAKEKLSEFETLNYCQFDFEDPSTFESALDGISLMYLLRPPHISNVQKDFSPLVKCAKDAGVRGIVFLSVQGAEKSKVIPHRKIEILIEESGIPYVFLRPGYFMQNLTNELIDDIQAKNKIIIPAGDAKFNWIDGMDIGQASARILMDFDKHSEKVYNLTGTEQINFNEVAGMISDITGRKIEYESPGLIRYYRMKKKQDIPRAKIIVMMMIHFLPRIQSQSPLSEDLKSITGKNPITLDDFIKREKEKFLR